MASRVAWSNEAISLASRSRAARSASASPSASASAALARRDEEGRDEDGRDEDDPDGRFLSSVRLLPLPLPLPLRRLLAGERGSERPLEDSRRRGWGLEG